MSFQPGHKGYIGLDNAGGAVQNVSTYADNFSLPMPTDMLDTTTFGSAVKRFIAGLSDGGQVSVSGPLDVTLHSQIAAMKAAQAAGTAGFSLLWGPGGSVASGVKFTCEVLVASYEVSAGVSGRVEFSASLQVDGAVTAGTW